jgi:predicted membrane-bound spermidine synthase
LVLGSSTHAYSLMLATFISGIAVGSWLVFVWRRAVNTLVAFAWAELALAGTLLVSLGFYDLLPYSFAHLADWIARKPAAYPLYELTQALMCFGVLFLPAVCLGMTLPLASRVATVDLQRAGRSVGRVFAVNTLGTVLGAAMTGLVFLPSLGLAVTLALGIGQWLDRLGGLGFATRPGFETCRASIGGDRTAHAFGGLDVGRALVSHPGPGAVARCASARLRGRIPPSR